MKRRSLLSFLPALPIAVAVPAHAARPLPDEPYDRMRRLSRDLSKTLAEIEKHPVAPSSMVAFVLPANGTYSHPCGTLDLDEYNLMMSRVITDEQAAALADWKAKTATSDKAEAAYYAWCDSLPRGVHPTTARDQTIRNAMIEASDDKWQAIHRFLRAFGSTPQVAR